MHVSVINDQASINNFIHAALCELFDKADTGGDGTISIAEYVAMCDEYGVELTEEHLEEVRAIANDNGEVSASSLAKTVPKKVRFFLPSLPF